jgi:alkylhydroperoxidase family enzyme
MLAGLGIDDPDITAMRDGKAPSDPAQAAVHDLARDIVAGRGNVPDATVDRAAKTGLTTEGILEILLESTFAGLVGMIDNLAGRVELDGFLAARAWT